MSLAAFIGGFGQGLIQGIDTKSAYQYRNSIVKMRNLQMQQAQASVADHANDVNSQFNQRAAAGSKAGQSGLLPGMSIPQGALAQARADLPANQWQTEIANLKQAGYTGQQLASGFARPPAYAVGTPGGMDADLQTDEQIANYGMVPQDGGVGGAAAAPSGPPAVAAIPQNPQPYNADGSVPGSGQARGGTVPVQRRGYAGGGPIDPDVAAAVSQANGQPNPPAPGGAIPAPPPAAPPAPGGYQATGPATPVAAPPPQGAIPPAPGGAPAPQQNYQPAGPAVPVGQPGPTAAASRPPPPGVSPQAHAALSQQLHPPGLTPVTNAKAPLPVSPQVVQASSPAEAAMKHGQLAFGLHPAQNPGANPAQAKANYTELQHGAGAESNAMVQAARQKVATPDMPLGTQNAVLLNNLYNYDLEYHGPQAAAADSFAVLQNYRVNMMMYGGAALSSFQTGNLPAAAHYMQEAYAFFPDGNDVTVKPGPNGSLVATRTDPNGKTLDTSSFATPQDLASFVQGTSSFEGYNAALAQATQEQIAQSTIAKNNDEGQAALVGAGLRGQEVSLEGQHFTDEDHNDDVRTSLAVQAANKGKAPKVPAAADMQAAGANIQALITPDPKTGPTPLMQQLDPKGKLTSPQALSMLGDVATDISAYNNTAPDTAVSVGLAALSNPAKYYDPSTGTINVRGQQLLVGPTTKLLLSQYMPRTKQ